MDNKPPEMKRLGLHGKAVGTETASARVEILDTGYLEMSGVDSRRASSVAKTSNGG